MTEEEESKEVEEAEEQAEQVEQAEQEEAEFAEFLEFAEEAEEAEGAEEQDDQEEDNEEIQDDQKEKPNFCFCIWNAISGQSIEELNVPMGNRTFLHFDPERKEVIALDNKKVQKYDVASESWKKFPVKIWNGVKTRNLLAKNSNTLLIGDYRRNTILCSLITGKAILKQRQRVTSCKLSSDRQKIVAGTSHGFIHISDCVRGCIIKSLVNQSREDNDDDDEPKTVFDCSFNADGKQILSRTRKRLTLRDIADLTLINLALPPTKSNSCTYCLSPNGQQLAVVEEMHTVSFKKPFPTIADLSVQTTAIRGTNNEGLNLQGVIANSSFKLAEEYIALLQKRGDYGIFNEIMIKQLFSSSSNDSEDVRAVVLIGEKLASIHARIIGSDLLWINLQRLDLSRNEIGDIGAEAIGKNEIWRNLETLNLHQNKIKADGALAIGANNIWKKLVTLDLSSNQISDKHILLFLCSNKTWEHLQSLLLIGNPAILETNDFCKILEGITSKSLKMLGLTQAKFEQALLQYLKYSASENVINLSLADSGYNDTYAEIIASNTTCTTLKKLDLKNNFISDKGGIKIGSNTSWINLEEMELSSNNLGVQTAVAIGHNSTWSKLRVLNLNGNKIRTEGSYAIGNNKTWIELQTLELKASSIDSKGVAALSYNKTWTKLQTLNLL